MIKPQHYFQGGGRFEQTCRFLNLLEPGHVVLSLSKLAVWSTGILVLFVALKFPDQITDLLGALGSFGTAMGNYGYRRFKQYESGNHPYPAGQSLRNDGIVPTDTVSGNGDLK